jgi:predicted nucleic acid-binding protein
VADVISNTSPLSYLHKLGRLDLLRDLFGAVLVPSAVDAELRHGRELGHDLPDPASTAWMTLTPARPLAARLATVGDLDPGEAAVLDWALLLPSPLAVLDERMARRAAKVLGIPCVGTIGILVEAKQRGLVPAVEPIFAELERLRFRFSPALRAWALEQAGER